jgi:hypothetical protein
VLVRNRAAADRSRGDNEPVLQMRLARPSDKTSVARVVGARCEWMEARGLPSWRGAADDLAARQGVPWVRRHAQVPQVAAYDQAQGFDLVREEQRTHARLWMLARRAERLDLSRWFGLGFREGTPVPRSPGASG